MNNGHISVGGYLKPRNAKITVHEAEQLFTELWRDHERALLFAFERRFELVEARLKAEISGVPLDEQAFQSETRAQLPTAEAGGVLPEDVS